MNSTHKVEVVPIVLEKHPNADSLSICNVFGGYTCVLRTEDWKGIELGAYIPPDSTVDVRRPEFSFLADQAKADGRARIKAKKLRGIVSYGLMVPAPAGAKVGDDVAELLDCQHYEPPIVGESRGGFFMGGEAASAPNVYHVKYDVDAFRRYHHLFQPGEPVHITEKCDGASMRAVYWDGVFHCGSRTEWKKKYPTYDHLTVESLVAKGMPEDQAKEQLERLLSKPKKMNLWWEVAERTPALEKFCRDNPGVVVHGEVFGCTNAIKYSLPDVNRIAVFDLMKDGKWLDLREARELGRDLPWVPVLADSIPYDFDTVCSFAEGLTTVADAKQGTIREGCVVKPIKERYDPKVGRCCFKVINPEFLERYR